MVLAVNIATASAGRIVARLVERLSVQSLLTSPLCDAKLAIMASSALDNPKHEAFAQDVALGMSAAESYRKNISKKASPATVETEGPSLARSPLVSLRISALKEKVSNKADKKFDLSKDKWLESMHRIARLAEESEDFAAAKGALAEVGKACDYYAPEKHKLEVEVIIGGNAESTGDD